MKHGRFRKIIFGKAALPLWLAFITYGLTEFFARYPEVTETVYSQTVFPVFSSVLSFLSQWVSFSLDDLFYASLAVFLLVLLTLACTGKIRLGRFFLMSIQTLAICYTLFYWFWGFNYYRSRINSRLAITHSKPDAALFARVFSDLIDQTNASYCTFENVSHSAIRSMVEDSYQKNALFLKLKYPQGVRRPKPITLSNFFSKASIAGYYGPFFSEVQINDNLLPIEYPQTLAHEYAHQFGITGEAEANFYSWLVCSRSESKYLRYSANISMLDYFLAQSKNLPDFQGLIHKLHRPVIDDIRKIQVHWAQLRNARIDKTAGKIYDGYLRTNKIEKGVKDYFGVVRFMMDFSTDSLAQQRMVKLEKH